MADFSCKRPFDVDDGELDGFTKQECFVLGYELSTIDRDISNRRLGMFEQPVHLANKDRIQAQLERHGRRYKWTLPNDDESESWVYLSVFMEVD